MNKSLCAIAIAAALGVSASVNAADIKLLNQDPPGVGLNDTTPATPVGGNTGTTRGEQARIAYQYAMDIWGGVLESSQTVNVYASFAPLACTAGSGVLAQAGPNWIFQLTSGGVSRRYGSPLADALTGLDLYSYFDLETAYGVADPGDIFSAFNGDLGKPGCLDGQSWYFGLDGKTPAGQTNFLNVVAHELAHGLGFSGFLNKTTGVLNGGISDAYTRFAYDNVLNLGFEQMNNAQRALAMRTPGRTVWRGANVTRDAALILDKRSSLRPTAPAAIAGKDYEIGYAAFGPLATSATFANGALVLIDDGNTAGGGTTTDGCSANGGTTTAGDTIAYVNAAAVAGKIAVIDRGVCSFEYKSKIAQDNGAIAVVLVNNAAGVIDPGRGTPITTGLTIPTVMVSQADGNEIKANLTGAMAGVVLGNLTAGTDGAGRVRLYSPTVVAGGSTFSHYDTALTPNALMEPFITSTLNAQSNVDLTPALFADIGWPMNTAGAKLGSPNVLACDTGIPTYEEGGLIPGATVQAAHNSCLISAKTRTQYKLCMDVKTDRFVDTGLLTYQQGQRVMACAKRVTDRTRFPIAQ